MTDQPDAADLRRFDEPIAIDLAPRIWTNNLAALRLDQPDFADALAGVRLPVQWRAVRALDGFATYRTEQSGEPAAWLANTAAPRTRATGVLAGLQFGDQNPTLPALTAGAELQLLLERLPAYKAVYVFEHEMTTLAAVLRAVDLAREITAGRCILVPPNGERPFLEAHLAAYPGLLPPGMILRLPDVTPARIEQLRVICEEIARKTYTARNARLGELASTAVDAPSQARLAVVALTVDQASRATGESVVRAARELSWDPVVCALNGPRDVHILPHSEILARTRADITLCVNHTRTVLPMPPGGTVCEWYLDSATVPENLPDDDVWRLGASPRIAAALRAAATTETRIAEWLWACEPHQAQGQATPRGAILLVADLPNNEPTAWGVEQPSHKQLWQHLRQAAARSWDTSEILQPQSLLSSAERACDIHLGEASVRELLLRGIEHALIPTVILEKIVETLGPSLPLLTVGTGWQRWPAKETEPFAESVFALEAPAEHARPPVAIFAGSVDPLTPALLHAGGQGWPLLIHSPGARALTVALGAMLHPQQHYQPFGGGKELRAAIQAFRQDPTPMFRRAARTQTYLLEQHSYAARLQQLQTLLRADPND